MADPVLDLAADLVADLVAELLADLVVFGDLVTTPAFVGATVGMEVGSVLENPRLSFWKC